jgi:hypothetical protein
MQDAVGVLLMVLILLYIPVRSPKLARAVVVAVEKHKSVTQSLEDNQNASQNAPLPYCCQSCSERRL